MLLEHSTAEKARSCRGSGCCIRLRQHWRLWPRLRSFIGKPQRKGGVVGMPQVFPQSPHCFTHKILQLTIHCLQWRSTSRPERLTHSLSCVAKIFARKQKPLHGKHETDEKKLQRCPTCRNNKNLMTQSRCNPTRARPCQQLLLILLQLTFTFCIRWNIFYLPPVLSFNKLRVSLRTTQVGLYHFWNTCMNLKRMNISFTWTTHTGSLGPG